MDIDIISAAIVELYLQTGEPVRPAAIAAHTKWSEAKVRRVMRERVIPRCVAVQVEVPTYSKSYRGMQHGTTRAWAHEPTKDALRDLVLEYRKGLNAAIDLLPNDDAKPRCSRCGGDPT